MLLLTLSFVPWSLSSCLIAENKKNRDRIKIGRTDISIKKTKRIQKRRQANKRKTVGKKVTWKVFEIFMLKSFKILKIEGLRV